MRRPSSLSFRLRTLAVVLCLSVLAGARPAGAQGSGNGFLFGAPSGGVTLHAGYALASASSDVFQFSTSQLTLNKGSFNAPDFGVELGFSVSPSTDFVLGLGYAGTSARSQFRHWLDNNNLPIEQTTTFERLPLSAGLKWYLTPPGRSIGRFAWVPTKYTPYVGLGGDLMWYRFRQNGDFVDSTSTAVFSDDFNSSSWTVGAHVLAGFEYSLSPRMALATEARYVWAKADLGRDFSGFQRIDLSGLSTTIGLHVRY